MGIANSLVLVQYPTPQLTMRFTTVQAVLLLAGIASADLKRVGPNGAHLFARQVEVCKTSNSCVVCFGPGNVTCQRNSCYNPSAGEQCCADGTYCVGSDTSCCGELGPGVTGGPLGTITSPTIASSTPSSTRSASVSNPTTTSRSSVNPTPTFGGSITTAATGGAAATGAIGGFAAAAAGVVGLALL